jgi:hypothetical protein
MSAQWRGRELEYDYLRYGTRSLDVCSTPTVSKIEVEVEEEEEKQSTSTRTPKHQSSKVLSRLRPLDTL